MKLFPWLTFSLGGPFGVLSDTPAVDAGGGGAAAPVVDAGGAGDGGDPSTGGADLVDAGAADTEPDDDDLLFAEDQEQPGRSEAEQLAALRKANNRLRRRFAKAKPVYDRVKDLNLDELQARARDYDSLSRDPRVRAALAGEQTPTADRGRAESSASKLPALPTEFTAETLGFDPNESPGNRVIAAAIQHVAELSKKFAALEKLQPTVEHLERSANARAATEEAGAWQTGLTSMLGKLKAAAPGNELLVTLARDAFVGAYHSRASHGRTPQQVVDHYLGQLQKTGQISKQAAATVSAGVKAQIAAHNQTLPKSPAGGGSPAPAAGNTRPSLRDIHKKVRQG